MYLVDPNYRNLLVSDTHDEDDGGDHDDDDDEAAHNYVFVNANGAPFKSSGFSTYLSRLLSRLTGSKATSNVLRSSFVTNLFESNPSDAAKSSRKPFCVTATECRPRRTISASLRTRSWRRSALRPVAANATAMSRGDPVIRTKAAIDFSRGMLVIVPFFDSQTGVSSFWFAKILNINDVEARPIELKLIPGMSNTYRADLKSTWAESIRVLRRCRLRAGLQSLRASNVNRGCAGNAGEIKTGFFRAQKSHQSCSVV
jgi:hypothetical protein